MHLPSDTPPDGDFAKYVEKLSASAEAGTHAKQAAAQAQLHTETARKKAPAPVAAVTARQTAGESASSAQPGPSLWTVGKWVLIAWIALQVMGAIVPGIDVLGFPLLLAFAAWVIYRVKKSSSAMLAGRLRELAEQATKEFKQRK